VNTLLSLAAALLLSASAAQANLRKAPLTHLPSADAMAKMLESNKLEATKIKKIKSSFNTGALPFAEYHKAGYLIFNDTFDFDSKKAKLTMAKNLPKDVKLVIYTENRNQYYTQNLLREFHKVISPSRLKLIHINNSNNGFWTRDALPVPMIQYSGDLSVVDAKYYHKFEPDFLISQYFYAGLDRHNFHFEGGNFQANSRGDCFIIDNKLVKEIPTKIFTAHYGCKTLTRLDHIKGIGHADESMKFIDDDTIITDSPEYRKVFESKGYTVHMIPRPDKEYETYVNSLIVNGTVYIPVFNEKNDQKAINVYKSLGLKTVPIVTKTLSNQGLGSLHCITMTYPPVQFNELLGVIKAN